MMAASATRALIKYRLRRLYNVLSVGFRRKRKDVGPRQAQARKGMKSWVTAVLLSFFFVYAAGQQSYQLVQKTYEILGQVAVSADKKLAFPAWNCSRTPYEKGAESIECRPLPPEGDARLPMPFMQGLALELLLAFIVAWLFGLASRELASPEWDLEWLVTLPLPRRSILHMRMLERTLVNPSGLLFVCPFLIFGFWRAGWAYAALPLGLFSGLLLLFLEAMLRTLVDTGLKIVLRPSTLRVIHALTSLLGSAAMFTLLSVLMSDRPFLLSMSLSPSLHGLLWTPVGLIIQIMAADSLLHAWPACTLLALQLLLVYAGCTQLLLHLLRFGVVAGSGREGVKRRALPSAAVMRPQRTSFLSPLQRRELMTLRRDPNFLMQTLILPIFMTSLRFLYSGSSRWKELFKSDFSQLAATAFGAAAYSLLFTAFQVLNAEGKALWILYSLPKRLDQLLREKLVLWVGVALLYPAVMFGMGIYATGVPSVASFVLIVLVFLGVIIYGVVAACLGIFASDPLAEDPRHRMRLGTMYLYLILAAFYSYAIFAQSYWSKLSLLVLSTLMALALLQKARDHMPYLLDPSEAPPSRVSLADGLIAALMFLVLQGLGLILMSQRDRVLSGWDILLAFSIAGAVTFISLRVYYWTKKTAAVPRILGPGLAKSCAYGVLAGLVAGAMGVAYIKTVVHYGLFPDSFSQLATQAKDQSWWLFVLGILAAPVFEEFIFRGIIFRGLQRSMILPAAAVASAGIFAIIHPPVGVVPVFALGVMAALSYARTNILLTPMLCHAVYNAIVLVYQTKFLPGA